MIRKVSHVKYLNGINDMDGGGDGDLKCSGSNDSRKPAEINLEEEDAMRKSTPQNETHEASIVPTAIEGVSESASRQRSATDEHGRRTDRR